MMEVGAQLRDTELIEGQDYTVENGYWIFARSYLLKRGFCCGSKCRNCPYPVEPVEA